MSQPSTQAGINVTSNGNIILPELIVYGGFSNDMDVIEHQLMNEFIKLIENLFPGH